ncbi:alginate lyase family protein [Streptomyces sp. SCSIO ZS0520]|uniref:alginate lyase family protein n=1 Tax=Streptomyces sp. SCSIO ZS0520 TaxID=2892996 RepID=UPI0021D7EFA1|nr:alginate lyase family protein [Streptomyces sp. SCSIO ZS0520]
MRPLAHRALAALLAPLLVLLASACGNQGRAAPRPRSAPGREFRHPGALVSGEQLDAVRRHVEHGEQPWLGAFLAMRDSRYGDLGHRPRPYATVACPPDTRPGRGCVEEREDAIAAYTQALLWYVTGERAHAAAAARIMDAWSAKVRRHTEGNAGLQAAWAGATWARAGEVLRTPGSGWPRASVRRFGAMLRGAYRPAVTAGAADFNGNWDLAMTDAALSIAVFLDDHAGFRRALDRFRARVPAYFYLRSDGPLPRTPPGSRVRGADAIRTYWFGQRVFRDGLAQESCRNFQHAGYALAATAHIAETAWHQGVDLYGPYRERLRAAVEFHARYQNGARAPAWLCGGKVRRTLGPDLEVLVNHLENRLQLKLPQADRLLRRTRPAGTDDLFVAWETLTQAGNPAG